MAATSTDRSEHAPTAKRIDATPCAGKIAGALRRRNVLTDHRGTVLRMGPAPYVTDAQLEEAVGLLGEAAGR